MVDGTGESGKMDEKLEADVTCGETNMWRCVVAVAAATIKTPVLSRFTLLNYAQHVARRGSWYCTCSFDLPITGFKTKWFSQLIHHTIGNFNIHPDKQAVTRINDSLATLQQSRDLRIREAESSLRKLGRQLNSVSAQHEEAVAVHDSSKHAEEIVQLDTKKFRIAKAATELEVESERLESELEMLKEKLADLESQGLEGDETTRREREADDATM